MTKAATHRAERKTRHAAAELSPMATETNVDPNFSNVRTSGSDSPASLPESGTAKTPRTGSKMAALVAVLSAADGATIAAMRELTGWQDHSVRGVLAGALKTKFGLTITSTKEEARGRVYRAVSPMILVTAPLARNHAAPGARGRLIT